MSYQPLNGSVSNSNLWQNVVKSNRLSKLCVPHVGSLPFSHRVLITAAISSATLTSAKLSASIIISPVRFAVKIWAIRCTSARSPHSSMISAATPKYSSSGATSRTPIGSHLLKRISLISCKIVMTSPNCNDVTSRTYYHCTTRAITYRISIRLHLCPDRIGTSILERARSYHSLLHSAHSMRANADHVN